MILYGLFVDWVTFDLNCWCSGLLVVANTINVSSNELEECVFMFELAPRIL